MHSTSNTGETTQYNKQRSQSHREELCSPSSILLSQQLCNVRAPRLSTNHANGRAHRRMPTCHQLLNVGGLLVCCEDHRPLPTFKKRAVTNAVPSHIEVTSAYSQQNMQARIQHIAIPLQTGAVTQYALIEPCGTQKVS